MAQLYVNALGFGEIGGVGEMIYRTVRFPDYKVLYDKDVLVIWPKYSEESELLSKSDYLLTGQMLLASLCNLYRKMNDPACPGSYVEMIVDWCKANTHPYQIDLLYEQLTDAGYDYRYFSESIMRDGIFEVEQFMSDLEKVYHTQCFYYALLRLSIGDDSYARHLYYEGRFTDSFPLFDKYKYTLPVEEPNEILVSDSFDILREMEKSSARIIPTASDDSVPAEDRPFVRDPMDDIHYLRMVLLEQFPEFRMKLKAHPKTGRIQFAADVRSVFDICWYTLSRAVADDAPPEDEDPNSMFREGSLLSCLCCGDFFVRRGPRQLYCNKEACQAARKRKNRRDCDVRKRAAKMQNR